MLGADEQEELHRLQARAYGRDGALNHSEAARLSELAARKTEPPRAEPPPLIVAVPKPEPVAPPAARDADVREPAPTGEPRALAPRSRRRAVFVVAIIAALVVGVGVGVGAGWVLFGQGSTPALALSPQEQQWQDDLAEAGDFDLGSLRALTREDDVVLWSATQNGGESTCVLIGNGESSGVSCQVTEFVRSEGLSVSLTQAGDQGAGQITGQILLALDGEPAASLDLFRYDTDTDGFATSFANADEERFADSLIDDGYSRASVQVVGYDGDNPIWTAFRADEGAQCLIYSVLPNSAWGRCTQATDANALVERVDEQTGQTTRVVWRSSNAGTHLMITKTESDDDAASE